ncbi:uncharacterized protein LOC125495732 [Beta vulgaris subsp. vulgaris]|uniref:uncharacterized protein LOC125495732 n=1 Tax=Beta vulgaris subsp. vulgaris TaxID=3555 RepID=UPI002036B5EA|nr:uncharacterized protein LOC125495732 [Beta vulgaris subsp. vulgaris]
MEDFPNASAYCQRLKMLADQLKNVGAPVTNNRLVLQMVAGLTEAYNGIGTLLRQSDPLPQFYQARSMLVLEEAGLAKKVTSDSSAMVVSHTDSSSNTQPPHTRINNGGKNKNKNHGKNKNSGGRNYSGGSTGGRHNPGGGGRNYSGSGGRPGGGQPGHAQQQATGPRAAPGYWGGDGPILLGLILPAHSLPKAGRGPHGSPDSRFRRVLGPVFLDQGHGSRLFRLRFLMFLLILKRPCTLLGSIHRIRIGIWIRELLLI